MKITAHCLVRNEFRFIWYSLMSIIDWVDKVLLWDTGSTDGTIDIIKEIIKLKPDKVNFREVGLVDIYGYERMRQELLDKTTTDWFIVVDGDEIWWEDSIKKVTEVVQDRGREIESIVVPTINLIGDVYHYQEEAAGQYRLAGRKGHLSLRLVNRHVSGLHTKRPHGMSGLFDSEEKLIQDRDPRKILFVDCPYFHATFLHRSIQGTKDADVPKRKQKLKYELGIPFPKDFYYPEVFFRPRPPIVPSPWQKRSFGYMARAAIETPFKKLKRRLFKSKKVGY